MVDDHTSATVEKVRGGLVGVEHDAHKAAEQLKHIGGGDAHGGAGAMASGMHAFSGAALAGVAAVGLLAVGLHEAYELSHMFADEGIKAANEYRKQEKAMAGVLMLVDAGAHSMKEIKEYAADVHEELEGAAVKMGVPAEKMVDAFNTLMERGGIASERAKELAQDMALVGKVTRGGMDGLANGFSMVEMGMIRARNPIVQLVASTHTLKGNAHAVAQQMMKMTPEHQMRVAEQAIAKQAELMRKGGMGANLGLDQLKNSFGGMREMFFVSMGQPMLDALLPPLNRVQRFLFDHIEVIKEWGARVGNVFATVIDATSSALAGIYKGIEQNADFIAKSFDRIFGDWTKAWNLAMEDSGGIEKTFASITDDLIHAFELGAKIIKASAEVLMDAYDLASGGKPGETQAHVAYQAITKSGSGGAGEKDFEASIDEYRRVSENIWMVNKDVVEANILRAREEHEAWKEASDAAKASFDSGDNAKYAEYLKGAFASHEKGSQEFAASLLAKSDHAKEIIASVADKIGMGVDDLTRKLSELDPALAKKLKPEGAKDITPQGHNVVFNNANITMHQDFRDQDPERVAIVFKREFARNAVSPLRARTGSPFGLSRSSPARDCGIPKEPCKETCPHGRDQEDAARALRRQQQRGPRVVLEQQRRIRLDRARHVVLVEREWERLVVRQHRRGLQPARRLGAEARRQEVGRAVPRAEGTTWPTPAS